MDFIKCVHSATQQQTHTKRTLSEIWVIIIWVWVGRCLVWMACTMARLKCVRARAHAFFTASHLALRANSEMRLNHSPKIVNRWKPHQQRNIVSVDESISRESGVSIDEDWYTHRVEVSILIDLSISLATMRPMIILCFFHLYRSFYRCIHTSTWLANRTIESIFFLFPSISMLFFCYFFSDRNRISHNLTHKVKWLNNRMECSRSQPND